VSAFSKENVESYLAAIVAAGKDHGLSLSHEDGHGSFIVRANNAYDDEVLETQSHVLVDEQVNK
jgi:hypothetical protein